ncbi:hypothetical protein lerEdw1_019802 [Lerista edwardsae]|nr:hypothetical protein lerEdw1_019802 [Lerista edwardsae]
MAVPPGTWPLLGLFWLVAALPVHGRGDAFQAEVMPENGLDETTSPLDDILDINQELILREAPESSFLIEGDIVKVSRTFPSANPRWPKKGGLVQIPYIISYKYDNSSVKRIKEAFRDFEEFTCVKFVPYSSQRDFICIEPLSGCFSSIGRTGGMQVVSLAAACLAKGKTVALHELMHVLGFWHEHSRADRDKYVRISWSEVLTGFEINFMKSQTTNMLVEYDYSSVMHYGRHAFGLRGFPTIVPLSRSCPGIGQSWNLSSSDVARVNKLYRCSRVAAQPEAAAESTTKETMADFLPSESKPYLSISKAGLLTAWSPGPVARATGMASFARETLQQVGTTLPSGRTPEDGFHATEENDWHTVSRETSSKAEVDGEHLMVTEGMRHRTQPTGMAAESIAQKASKPQALQSIASSPNQPLHYEGYTLSWQNATVTTRRAAPQVVPSTSPPLTSSASLPTDVAEGTAGRPSKSILHQLLSGTRFVHGEQTGPSTSTAVGSNAPGDGSRSPASSAMEIATKEQEEVFHTTMNHAGDQVGYSVRTPLMGVWAKATSSPYITLSPKGLGSSIMTTNTGGPSSPTDSEARSQSDFTIDHYSGLVDMGVGRLHEKTEEEMTSTLSSSRRASLTSKSVLLGTSEEAPALESAGGELNQRRPTTGAQSPWDTITGYLSASRLIEEPLESHPTGHSKEVEQSSLPPVYLPRGGELSTLLSPGSVSPTEQTKSEESASVHIESMTTLKEMASLETETKPVALLTEGGSLLGLSWSQSPQLTELSHTASRGQPGSTKVYVSSTLLSGQTPPAGVHDREVSQPALEAVSLVTVERPSLGQGTSLGHEEDSGNQVHAVTELSEETKMEGRASLWRVSTAPPGTQMPLKVGYGVVATQWPQPSSLSIGTHAPGASDIGLHPKYLPGLRTSVSTLSWTGGVTGSPHMAESTKGLSASSGLQLKLKVTEETSPRAEATEPGSVLPASETVTSPSEASPPPSWVSSHGELGEDNGTDHYTESLEDASSSARKEPSKLLKGSSTASNERTTTIHMGSSMVSTALALRGPTSQVMAESQYTHPMGGTESPTDARSLLVPVDQTTERNDYSKLEKARPFAEGRLAEPAIVTGETAQEGTNLATTRALNATLEHRGLASPLLHVGSTALTSHALTKGMALPRTTSSLESPKLVFYSGELAASHTPGEIAPPTGLPVGIATASQVHTASAIPLETWESQTPAATDVRAAVNMVSKPSTETAAVGTLPPTNSYRPASPGASLLGGTATRSARVGSPQLLTVVAHLEGTAWSTSATQGEAKVLKFIFEKGKSHTVESGVQVSPDSSAIYTGSKRSAMDSTEIPEPASMDAVLFFSSHTRSWGESTASSVGLTSKWPLETFGSPTPGNGRPSEMASSVHGAENSSGGEKVLPSKVSLENRNPIPLVTTASSMEISPLHPQTLGLAEIGTSAALYPSHATQGPHGYSKLLLSKRTSGGMGSKKHLSPSPEAAKQTSKAQTAVSFPGKAMRLSKELQQNGRLPMDNPNIHQVGKRSLREMMPIPSLVFILAQERYQDCEPLRWQIGHLKSREVADSEAATRAFLRKRVFGDTHELPVGSASGCSNQMHLGDSAIGHPEEDPAMKDTAKRTEPARDLDAESAHPKRRLFLQKMSGNAQLVLHNVSKPVRPLTFCYLEEDLCGWEHSKEEDFDWVLEKEQEQPELLRDGGIPSRISDGE